MSLLKLGSLDLGSCPACGRKLFPAAYVIRDGHRFHPECFRQKRARRATSTKTTLPPQPRPAERRSSPAPLAPDRWSHGTRPSPLGAERARDGDSGTEATDNQPSTP